MSDTQPYQKVARVKAELERVDKELEALQRRRDDLLIYLRVDKEYELLAGTDTPAPVDQEASALAGLEVDFTGTANLLERILRVAAATDEPLDAMAVAEYLVARGQSGANPKNLRSQILNVLKDDPDFEKVGVGRFRYIPNSESDFPEGTPTPGTSPGTML